MAGTEVEQKYGGRNWSIADLYVIQTYFLIELEESVWGRNSRSELGLPTAVTDKENSTDLPTDCHMVTYPEVALYVFVNLTTITEQ